MWMWQTNRKIWEVLGPHPKRPLTAGSTEDTGICGLWLGAQSLSVSRLFPKQGDLSFVLFYNQSSLGMFRSMEAALKNVIR